MLTYLSLIPTFLSLDSRIILTRFQGDFINSYLLVNISAINNANQYSFHFTEGYINDWIDRWRREYGNIIGLDPVIKALKQEHKLKLNSSGVVTITCETIDPEYFEFIKSELEFHYDKISINLATIIQEFDYGTPTLIRPLNSLGDDLDMEDLSKEIHQYLQDIFREGVSILALYCIKATRELTETYKGRIVPFILQAGYGELVQIHNSSGTYIQRIRDLNSSVQRTCKSVTNVQQRNWEIN